MKTICIMGLGYIGLPTASLFANNGFNVIGVDTNPNVVDVLNSGQLHIKEVGLRTLVEAAIGSGQLRITVSPTRADVYIICVPTPLSVEGKPDLSHVIEAMGAILPFLEPGNLIIVESTVPPHTTRRLAEYVARRRPDLRKREGAALEIYLAHCPERVLPGRVLVELVENDRIIGGLDRKASELAYDLYSRIVSGSIYRTDATTAEMVKLAENTFRDVNIALSNELALICEKLGINVWDVIRLANKHPRVNLLNPGPGVGGHCIAVDPWFIVSEFPDESKVIKTARLRNDEMPLRVAEQIMRIVGEESKPKVACLGAAYKANVGDLRNSPAVEIFKILRSKFGQRAAIVISDTHATNSDIPLESLETAVGGASLLVLLTDHNEYKLLDPLEIGKKMKKKVLLDTRNGLNHETWKSAGFQVYLLGNGYNADHEVVESDKTKAFQ